MNWYQRALQYLRDIHLELKKVTWPTKPEVVGTTVVVLVICVIFAGFLWGMDILFSKLLVLILGF
jgi:preprotein translocase subunit SecE